MDDFGFVETIDGLGQGVVVGVPLAAHGSRNTRFFSELLNRRYFSIHPFILKRAITKHFKNKFYNKQI